MEIHKLGNATLALKKSEFGALGPRMEALTPACLDMGFFEVRNAGGKCIIFFTNLPSKKTLLFSLLSQEQNRKVKLPTNINAMQRS